MLHRCKIAVLLLVAQEASLMAGDAGFENGQFFSVLLLPHWGIQALRCAVKFTDGKCNEQFVGCAKMNWRNVGDPFGFQNLLLFCLLLAQKHCTNLLSMTTWSEQMSQLSYHNPCLQSEDPDSQPWCVPHAAWCYWLGTRSWGRMCHRFVPFATIHH